MSYSVSDVQHVIKYIIKKPEAVTDNRPIENSITFRIKTGYYFGLLTPVDYINLSSPTKYGKNNKTI